jgi:hypothetical protein
MRAFNHSNHHRRPVACAVEEVLAGVYRFQCGCANVTDCGQDAVNRRFVMFPGIKVGSRDLAENHGKPGFNPGSKILKATFRFNPSWRLELPEPLSAVRSSFQAALPGDLTAQHTFGPRRRA